MIGKPGAVALLLITAAASGGTAHAAAEQARRIPHRDAAPIVRSVLERPFAFCHDRRIPLTEGDLRWRDLLQSKEAQARCPDLLEAWKRGATATEPNHQGPSEIPLPAAGPFLQTFVWIGLGLLVALFLARLFSQGVAFRRSGSPAERPPVPGATVSEAATASMADVETDVERLLSRARSEAAAGQFQRAIADAYAALLRSLAGAGAVQIEADRTNGDHVREVGRRFPALRSPVEATFAAVEEVQFGGAPADEGRFRRIYDGVVGLIARRLAQPLAILLLCGFGSALTGCAFQRVERDQAPSGHAAVLAFLQQYGFEARERLSALTSTDDPTGQLVVLPGATVDEAGWTAIEQWVDDGGTLFVAGGDRELPDWIGVAIEPARSSSSGRLTAAPEQAARFERVRAVVPPGPHLRPLPAGGGSEHELAEPPRPLLLRAATLYAVEQAHGEGRVVVLADDSLFANAALLVEDDAGLLADLLREGGRTVELAGELTGAGSPNPLTSVRRGRLAPAMLQLALLVLLFFACKGTHFGRPVDRIETHRRAFSEHVRALGLQYARAHASRRAFELYGGYGIERLRERLRLGRGKGLHAVAEGVAARGGRPIGEVMRLLVDAHPGAPGQTSGGSAAEDLASMRQIATLLTEIGGAGERSRARAEG